MKKSLSFLITIFPHLFQSKNSRNRKALRSLKKLNYPMPEIRRALLQLNDLNIIILANGHVSGPTIYGTISGDKRNRKSQELIAAQLHLKREELFPDDE
jgi:hypothetical protein